MKNTAVLLLSTPMRLARKGAVAAVSQFLIAHNGGVLHSDDHLDSGRDLFLSRLEWDLDEFDIPISDFERHFQPLADHFSINFHLALTDYRPKIAILVSAYDHCLADLLYRQSTGELAERALGHVVQSKVEGAYLRTDALEARRPLMQAWVRLRTGRSARR